MKTMKEEERDSNIQTSRPLSVKYKSTVVSIVSSIDNTLYLTTWHNLERSPVEDALATNSLLHTLLGSLCISRHLVIIVSAMK